MVSTAACKGGQLWPCHSCILVTQGSGKLVCLLQVHDACKVALSRLQEEQKASNAAPQPLPPLRRPDIYVPVQALQGLATVQSLRMKSAHSLILRSIHVCECPGLPCVHADCTSCLRALHRLCAHASARGALQHDASAECHS